MVTIGFLTTIVKESGKN